MTAPDMTEVPAHQQDMHHRLATDWRAYCGGAHDLSSGYQTSGLFALYRAPKTWHAEEAPPLGDVLKGEKLNNAIKELPVEHRKALQWFYIKGGAPWRAAKGMGMTKRILKGMVIAGRQRLIDGGV